MSARDDDYLEATPKFYGVDERIMPDPFYHPPRQPMGYAGRKACGQCPYPGVQTVHPSLPKDPHNKANDLDLIGMGREADETDYYFGSSLNQKWCGVPTRRAGYCCDRGQRPDCADCPCITLRDPCTLQSGAWEKNGCLYGGEGWFLRDPASFQSPNNGNITANIRWG